MNRKRKNIPAGVRWEVFQRDDFRCVYCGWARKDGADLVVDHGDPFSKGGDDNPSNFVTACRLCNAGKRDKEFLPQAAEVAGVASGDDFVVRRGVAYKSQLHADWADAFRQCCLSVEYLATKDCPESLRTVRPLGADQENTFSVLRLDFECDFYNHAILNVVILENRDRGCLGDRDKRRIRDAAVLGYTEPTAIIIGSPWMFYGAVVNERYKGCPAGFSLGKRLDREEKFWSSGWYPDENWRSFADPREEFPLRPTSLELMGWHTTIEEALEHEKREVRYGL